MKIFLFLKKKFIKKRVTIIILLLKKILNKIHLLKVRFIVHLRKSKIQGIQFLLLRKYYSPKSKKIILFLTLGKDIVNGGIMSISSIYEESKKLKSIHESEVIICTIPGDPLLLKYTKFQNKNYLYSYSKVLSYFKNIEKITIHIPEYCIKQFLLNISDKDKKKINKIANVCINIMLQNLELLSPMEDIKQLMKLGHVTCTTAHEQYSTREIRERLCFPLHKLSVYVSPEQYEKKGYKVKENLMIISPDHHPIKLEVINLIRKQFPRLTIKVIQNMTYEKYKNYISRAKWALTFGEGLDGYFLETIFSGGVSFGVYNTTFFTDDFKSLSTVYDHYNILSRKICLDIENLDNEKDYATYQDEQYKLCCKYYSYEEYVCNLKRFYKKDYTFK